MNNFSDKTILITGGTGSFGKSFIKFLLKKKNFKKIIIFSRDELKQFELRNELDNFDQNKIRFFLGDVRDKDRLIFAFKDVDIVVHAAALKQVPAAEYNPIEFVKTNVIGAQNIVEASLQTNVKKVIALSTDKAVSPINLYGATKLCSDKLFIAANNIIGKKNTIFSIVRYGNVLGSRGSILLELLKQKKNNKDFKITDLKMTRFNILMKDAISLIMWSIENLKGGEIVIPKLKSIKIIELAKAIKKDAKLKIIGARPGEKIHEELLSYSDSFNLYDYKNHYLLIPENLKEKYYGRIKLKKINKNFSYNSEKNIFLSIKEIQKILLNNSYLD